jgi:hypothetical protein
MSSETVVCPGCGRELADGVRFCVRCGCRTEDPYAKLGNAVVAAETRLIAARDALELARPISRMRHRPLAGVWGFLRRCILLQWLWETLPGRPARKDRRKPPR